MALRKGKKQSDKPKWKKQCTIIVHAEWDDDTAIQEWKDALVELLSQHPLVEKAQAITGNVTIPTGKTYSDTWIEDYAERTFKPNAKAFGEMASRPVVEPKSYTSNPGPSYDKSLPFGLRNKTPEEMKRGHTGFAAGSGTTKPAPRRLTKAKVEPVIEVGDEAAAIMGDFSAITEEANKQAPKRLKKRGNL